MPKRPSAYHRPATIDDALRLLSQPDTVALAGGTTLLAGNITSAVVDLQELGLNKIRLEEDELQVGATTKLTDLMEFLEASGADGGPGDVLRKATRLAGPNTIRNAATVGGVIAARLPDSELLAALLVLETRLSILEPQARTMNLAEFLGEPERPSGLITDVSFRWEEGRGSSARVARTPADYPIVSVTVWQPANGAPRLAATGIAARPMRLTLSEEPLAVEVTDETIRAAARVARDSATHPGDFRGSAQYRAEMASVLTKRVLRNAA